MTKEERARRAREYAAQAVRDSSRSPYELIEKAFMDGIAAGMRDLFEQLYEDEEYDAQNEGPEPHRERFPPGS